MKCEDTAPWVKNNSPIDDDTSGNNSCCNGVMKPRVRENAQA